MRINFRVVIALLVVALAAFWAFDSVRERTYSGDNLIVPIGSGPVIINHNGDVDQQARLTATGTRGNFTARSNHLDSPVTSTREGSGRNVTHSAEFVLPPGTTEISLTRGSNVTMAIEAANPVNVVVNPLSSEQATTTVIAAVVVILASLYYASRATNHSLVRSLFNRGSSADQRSVDSGMVTTS